jgi:copper chaperone CopZ
MPEKQKGARKMEDTKKEKTTETEKARIVVSVSEINCTVCATAIQKQVMKISGVKRVKPAIMLNKVFIDYDPKLVDSSIIRKAINKTGFKSYMTVKENR